MKKIKSNNIFFRSWQVRYSIGQFRFLFPQKDENFKFSIHDFPNQFRAWALKVDFEKNIENEIVEFELNEINQFLFSLWIWNLIVRLFCWLNEAFNVTKTSLRRNTMMEFKDLHNTLVFVKKLPSVSLENLIGAPLRSH